MRGGMTIGLVGSLGAGKTHLVKGIAWGNGVSDRRRVTSPTFTLIQDYPGKLRLYHVDVYRLAGVDDAEQLGLSELQNDNSVVVIEWADRIRSLLPAESVWIEMEHVGQTTRRITAVCESGLGAACLRDVAATIR